jgi:hypothetical protein
MTARRAIVVALPAAAEPAASIELETLARQVGALRLNWSDPWAARLRRLARWAREQEARLSAGEK